MAAFDPLASSQISIDPVLGGAHNQGLLTARIRQLITAGMSPEEAARTAQAELDIHGAAGGDGGGMVAILNRGDKPEVAQQAAARVAGLRQREDQQAAFENEYNAATGMPGEQEVSASGRPMGPMNVPTEPAYGRRVPGPRTLDGKPVDRGAPFKSEDEAAAYDDREIDPATGFYTPSQRDKGMAARGMVPRYNPDGTVGYGVASPESGGDAKSPIGGAGRAGRRLDLEAAGWEAVQEMTPTGMQWVYRPGANQKEDASRRLSTRLANNLGMSLAEAEKANMDDEAMRDAAGKQRALGKQARQDAYIRRSQAMQNPLEYIGRDDINNWQRMIAADRMLRGGFTGPTPLGVDAVGAQNAMRFVTAEAIAGMDPVRREAAAQAAAMNTAKESENLPAEAHADMVRRQNGGKLPPGHRAAQRVMTQINDEVIGFFATDAEIEEAIAEAERQGVDPTEARSFFQRRRKDMLFFGAPAGGQKPGATQRPMPPSRPL